MPVRIEDVKWGSYKEYEGPVFWGSKKMALPKTPTENDILVYILTQTEGGCVDQVNAYDRCIVSAGLFQWCEASYFLTSRLLGAIVEKDPALATHLSPALHASNAEFKRNANGKWRFFFKDGRGEVDTIEEQRQLFLLNASGLKGSFDEASKAHVKLWTTCIANLLQQPSAIEVQTAFCADRVKGFATADAKKILFDEALPSMGWTGAMRAVYLSFAGNLPAVADKHLKIALQTAPGHKWSKEWCVHIMKELAFGPKIAIFPGRYDKIRALVEQFYKVDLPDMAKDLQAWQADFDSEGRPEEGEPTFFKVEEIQQLFLDLGFDLGPAAADGKLGTKTKDALLVFQRTNGLQADGILGPKTRAKMLEVWRYLATKPKL